MCHREAVYLIEWSFVESMVSNTKSERGFQPKRLAQSKFSFENIYLGMGGRQEWSFEDQRDIVILGSIVNLVGAKSPKPRLVQVENGITLTLASRVRRVPIVSLVESWPCRSVLSSRLLSWAWIAASPSEVSVLLFFVDVPLCHLWEYLAISWMATFASAAVLVDMAHFESRILRVGGQYLLKDFDFRVSQFVIKPDGSFLSHRLAAPVRDMGKARSIIWS
nr:hypothetical protein [Tanacetum cinerariifolium]